jgi:DNA-binding protein WhiA
MGDPSKGYQLFIYPPSGTDEFIYSILKEEIPPKRGKSKGKDCFYYKSADGVSGFLTFCKASPYAIKVLQEGIVREEKARLQRFCNAEIANMDRTSTAAAEQLAAIKLLRKYNMIDNLKPEYKEAALLRELYPEAGLGELASLSLFPISKSGLNYRLKKLISISKELKEPSEP